MVFTRPLRKSWLHWRLDSFASMDEIPLKRTEFLRLVEALTLTIRDREFGVWFESPTSKWVLVCLDWIFEEFSFLLSPRDLEISPIDFASRIRKWGAVNERAIYAASVLEALVKLDPQE